MTFLLGELEDSFESQHYLAWFKQNWRLSFLLSAVYVIVIFGGQAWMKARPRFELRAYLAAWSGILALFSISGALVTVKDMHRTVSESGWHSSVCNADFFEGKVGFWTLLFVFSKVPELGDTVFIVLRKQKLVFLHWYHHITVLIYTWYSYQENVAGGRYFITLNYAVVTLMVQLLRVSGDGDGQNPAANQRHHHPDAALPNGVGMRCQCLLPDAAERGETSVILATTT